MTPEATQRAAAREARKQRRHSRRREEFLEAARTVLRTVGLDRMTMAQVAREAGETDSLLYYYFENRDALLLSVAVANILRDVELMTEAVDAAPNGVEAVAALMRCLVGIYRDDLEGFRLRMWVAMRRVSPDDLREIYPRINHLIDLIDAKLAEDQSAGTVALQLDRRARAGVALTQAEGILMNYALIEGIGADITVRLDVMLDQACHQAARGLMARED